MNAIKIKKPRRWTKVKNLSAFPQWRQEYECKFYESDQDTETVKQNASNASNHEVDDSNGPYWDWDIERNPNICKF
jgi:hypothetical protein